MRQSQSWCQNYCNSSSGPGVDIANVFGPAKYFKTVGDLTNVLLPNILMITGVIALIAVLITGVRFIQHAGSGDAKQAQQDQGAFTAAITGLIMIFGSFWFLQIAGVITGFDFLNPTI